MKLANFTTSRRHLMVMKKIPVAELIQKLEGLTMQLSEAVRQEFEPLTQEQLFWRPNERSWSIAECLAHLNAYYRYYIPVFNERIKNSRFRTPGKTFQSSPLGNATWRSVKLGKLMNVRRVLKSPKDYNPLVNKTLKTQNAISDFLSNQDEMLDVLRNSSQINIRKAKCSLSVRPIVKLRMGDAFQFIVYHAERHIEQARKVKSMKGFPKA